MQDNSKVTELQDTTVVYQKIIRNSIFVSSEVAFNRITFSY